MQSVINNNTVYTLWCSRRGAYGHRGGQSTEPLPSFWWSRVPPPLRRGPPRGRGGSGVEEEGLTGPPYLPQTPADGSCGSSREKEELELGRGPQKEPRSRNGDLPETNVC